MSENQGLTDIERAFNEAFGNGELSSAASNLIAQPGIATSIRDAVTIDPDDLESSSAFLMLIILDDSGSLSGFEDCIIEGFNCILDGMEASKVRDDILVLTFTLNNGMLDSFMPVEQATRLSRQNYFPGGGTPLIPTIETAIADFLAQYEVIRSANIDPRGAIVIVTDGGDTTGRNPEELAPLITNDIVPNEWITISAMGIGGTRPDFYKDIFTRMGIPEKDIVEVGVGVTDPDALKREVRLKFQAASRTTQTMSRSSKGFSGAASSGLFG